MAAHVLMRLWRLALDLGLRMKVAVVFVGVLVFAGLNIGLVHHMLQNFNGVAATATVAGKMRMLGQKLAYETLSVSAGLNEIHDDIEHDVADFEAAYLVLRSGGVAFDETIRPLGRRHQNALNSVWLAWQQYRDLIRGILVPAAGPGLRELVAGQKQLADLSAILLERTDILIQDLVQEAQATQQGVLGNMLLLLALSAVILLLAYLTFSTHIIEPLRRLARHCHELAKGNYGERTRHDANDEIGELAHALNHSGRQIGELMAAVERERRELSRKNAMFQGLASNAVVGVFMVDGGMRLRYVNQKLSEMFGYRPEELSNRLTLGELLSTVGPDGRWEAAEDTTLDLFETSHYVSCAHHRDGTAIDIEVYASRMVLDEAPAVIGIVLDVTERKKAEVSRQRAALVYANTSEAVVVTDANGFIVDVNPAFSAVTGYALSEVAGKGMNMLSSGRHDASFYYEMWASLQETGKWAGDIWNRHKNGEEYIERLIIDTTYNEDGTVNCHIGVFSDVTAQRQKEETIWRQAHFDHLTGLPNRQMFHEELRQAMERASQGGYSLALICIDLDLFKEVNDSLGHDRGDELLKEISRRLTRSVRRDDLVARLGGDEFTLILGREDRPDTVENVCRRVLEAVAEPCELGHSMISITASLGITFYPRDGVNVTELMKNADLAMYSAKSGGRNQHRYFAFSMQREAHERRLLLNELQGALANGEFELYFQPIIELSSNRICKAEALLRWRHPRRGLVAPMEFIPAAEDSGLIVPLGDWILREAAMLAARWRAQSSADFQVSVNVSPVQFAAEGLDPAGWIACMERHGLPGSAVLVEITERLLLEVDGESKNKLLAFRDAGVQVALDDFGTGYSSLSYLKRFDIDFIKIDQLFVRNIAPDNDDLVLCQAIIVMAHRLGLKVVAEGVSTLAQHQLLLQAGCDYAQGYLYSRPVPAESFDLLLDAEVSGGHGTSLPAEGATVGT
ncbi:MAG: EAL domain-containing protein [Burkholderiaceae bacterium]